MSLRNKLIFKDRRLYWTELIAVTYTAQISSDVIDSHEISLDGIRCSIIDYFKSANKGTY
jgi:hypothetical protein